MNRINDFWCSRLAFLGVFTPKHHRHLANVGICWLAKNARNGISVEKQPPEQDWIGQTCSTLAKESLSHLRPHHTQNTCTHMAHPSFSLRSLHARHLFEKGLDSIKIESLIFRFILPPWLKKIWFRWGSSFQLWTCVYIMHVHTHIYYIILYYIMYTSTWRDRDGSGQCLNPLTSQAIRNSCTWFDLTCGHFGPLVSFFAPTRNKHMPISCNKAAALNAYKYPTDGFPRGKTLCTTLVSKSTSYIYIYNYIYIYI